MKTADPQFSNGLSVIRHPSEQPKGTYRYCLNGVLLSKEGDFGHPSTEPGNSLFVEFTEYGSNILLGHCYLDDDSIVLFLVSSAKDLSSNAFIGTIIRVYPDKTYTVLIRDEKLNFSIEHQIETTFRVFRGCERIIYFTDNYNPIRAINIDKVDQYFDQQGNLIPELLELQQSFFYPEVDGIKVYDSGGFIKIGTHQLIARYMDEQLNATTWVALTNPIAITNESYSANALDIDGGTNDLYNGTTKSIEYKLVNLDTKFKYIQFGIIEAVSGTGVKTGFIVDTRQISGSNMTYLYRGVDSQNAEPIDLADVAVEEKVYTHAKTLTQVDGRLYIGNLQGMRIDFGAFQRKANEIQVRYVTRPMTAGSGYKFPDRYFDFRTYMRDEVYALGIVWIFKNGTVSPVFHIPGRQKDIWDPNLDTAEPGGYSTPGTYTGLDSNLIIGSEVEGIYGPGARREAWKVYNTAIRTDKWPTQYAGEVYSKGIPAYWESIIDYPDYEDDQGRIYPSGKIRHHKMPDARLEPHWFGPSSKGIPSPNDRYNRELDTPDDVLLPLHLEFSNIQLPAGYEDLVAGYKIVRARFTEENKSVVLKGLAGVSEGYDSSEKIEHQMFPGFFKDTSVVDAINYLIDLDNNRQSYPSTYASSMFILSPDHLLSDKPISGDYIKVEKVVSGIALVFQASPEDRRFHLIAKGYGLMDYSPTNFYTNGRGGRTYAGIPMSGTMNNLCDGFFNLDHNTYLSSAYTGSIEYRNDFQQRCLVALLHWGYNTRYDFFPENNVCKRIIDPNLIYNFSALYVTVKRVIEDQHGNLEDLVYVDTDHRIHQVNEVPIICGDAFIGRFDYRRTIGYYSGIGFEHNYNFSRVPVNKPSSLVTFFTESWINPEMRHEDPNAAKASTSPGSTSTIAGLYYPKSFRDNPHSLADYLSEGWELPEALYYNPDFHTDNEYKTYYPLPLGFDYKSKCLHKYPFRVAHSIKAVEEERVDSFRIFMPLDYKDFPANKGEVVKITGFIRDLAVITKRSIFYQPLQPVELNAQTDDPVYLISGKMFERPHYEVNSDTEGYGGSVAQFGIFTTSNLLVVPSTHNNEILVLSKKETNIASKSNFSWFKENMPLTFPEQYKQLTGRTISYNNPANPYLGVGYISTFDSALNRIIITKRDFRYIGPELYNGGKPIKPEDVRPGYTFIVDDSYLFPEGIFMYKSTTGDVYPITLDNRDFFEDLSWTFSFLLGGLIPVSFHSYIPNNYIQTKDTFISHTADIYSNLKLYKHNEGEHLSFYGEKKPFIIEAVLIPMNYKQDEKTRNEKLLMDIYNALSVLPDSIVIDDVKYISEVLTYDSNTQQWKLEDNETFTHIFIRSESGSTGKLPLIVKQLLDPFQSVLISGTSADKVDDYWRINNIRSVANSRPFTSKNWNDIKNFFPVDIVPVNTGTPDPFNLPPLKGKYFILRLYYEPTTSGDKKLILRRILPDMTMNQR